MRHAALIGEDFAGMRAQGRGLAERAGLSWSFHPVRFNKTSFLNRLPVSLWYDPLARIERMELPSQTDLVIGLGGRGGGVAGALGQKFGLPVVQIQHPRRSIKDFRLLIVNNHDISPHFYHRHSDKIIVTRTALHPVTPELLQENREKWYHRHKFMQEPFLGILLGGSNGRFSFGQKEVDHIVQNMKDFIRYRDVPCVITQSRRTSPAMWHYLKEKVGGFPVFFLEGDGRDNPYFGLLACAAGLAVTTDSVSMISEAAATTSPVGILPLGGQSRRINRFLATLEQAGRIESFQPKISWTARKPLDDTGQAAMNMLKILNLS